jgi:hypothetical protein
LSMVNDMIFVLNLILRKLLSLFMLFIKKMEISNFNCK